MRTLGDYIYRDIKEVILKAIEEMDADDLLEINEAIAERVLAATGYTDWHAEAVLSTMIQSLKYELDIVTGEW